jgi:hypothetical protein
MMLVTRMTALEANRRGNQWHPRVQSSVRKQAPFPGCLEEHAFGAGWGRCYVDPLAWLGLRVEVRVRGKGSGYGLRVGVGVGVRVRVTG